MNFQRRSSLQKLELFNDFDFFRRLVYHLNNLAIWLRVSHTPHANISLEAVELVEEPQSLKFIDVHILAPNKRGQKQEGMILELIVLAKQVCLGSYEQCQNNNFSSCESFQLVFEQNLTKFFPLCVWFLFQIINSKILKVLLIFIIIIFFRYYES